MASLRTRSFSSSVLLLLLLLLAALLAACGAAAQSAAAVAENSQEAAPKPLVPDLELPPKRKKQIVDDQGGGAAAAADAAPSPAPSAKAKRSEGGRGFGSSSGNRRSAPGKRRKDDFDYFLFVRQYDPAICDSMSCRVFPKKQDFTIHGLWPERLDGSWPQYCNSSDRFDADRVAALLPRLREQWPSFGMGADAQFWGHEWMRHGTCAGKGGGGKKDGKTTVDPSSGLGADEETYFGTVLDLHAKYPLLPALEAAGIVPSDEKTYARADVVEALRESANATGATRPAVHCGSGRRGSGELTEVWLCLSKEALEPFDCPENVAMRRVGKGGDTGMAKGGCETLKLPKLRKPPNQQQQGARNNKNSGSSSSSKNKAPSSSSAAAAPKGGFGAAGDAAVTLVAEKSL